jgi:hypothetical protein
MKLTQLVAKPQLIEISIDDSEIIQKFGEAITFHTWDRQPMDTFMKLASATDGKTTDIINIVKDLILDEMGNPILTSDNMLPTDVLMKAIAVITQTLGN